MARVRVFPDQAMVSDQQTHFRFPHKMNFHYYFFTVCFTRIDLLFTLEINSGNLFAKLAKPLPRASATFSHANFYHDYANYETDEASEGISCVCGQANQFKIIGGSETLPNEYPWMAYLLITKARSTFTCGGFLVSDRHVVTAAHCTINVAADGVRVMLGHHDHDTFAETKSMLIQSRQIVVHPRYDRPQRHDNDVSVVALRRRVRLGPLISPICLPPSFISDARDLNNYTERVATVMGWGRVDVGGPVSDVLLQANVPVISNEVCSDFYANIFVPITSRMICAGSPLGGQDSCQGDSGGPLVIREHNRHFAIGIVSFGFSCALSDFPGVYTRVDRVLPFIFQNTIDGRFC